METKTLCMCVLYQSLVSFIRTAYTLSVYARTRSLQSMYVMLLLRYLSYLHATPVFHMYCLYRL